MNVQMKTDRKRLELPPGSKLTAYQFRKAASDQEPPVVSKFAIAQLALRGQVSLQFLPEEDETSEPSDVSLLEVPCEEGVSDELASKLQAWAEFGLDPLAPRCGMLQLQGCRIFWGPSRIALVAGVRRLESAAAAILEAFWLESQLRELEHWLKQGWTQWQNDLEPAFEFSERQLRQRPELRQRYQAVLSRRAELVQLIPRLHFPPTYPPTLASQIGERVRERTRLVERAEFASQQLEVYERVYEQAGQRRNEFLLARSSNQLEWIIILLLLAQIVLVLVEMLGGQGVS